MRKRFLTFDRDNPPAGVGADGCTGYDVIVERVQDFKNSTTSTPIISYEVSKGCFAEVVSKCRSGVPVSGMLRTKTVYPASTDYGFRYFSRVVLDVSGTKLHFSGHDGTSPFHVSLFDDNEIEYREA